MWLTMGYFASFQFVVATILLSFALALAIDSSREVYRCSPILYTFAPVHPQTHVRIAAKRSARGRYLTRKRSLARGRANLAKSGNPRSGGDSEGGPEWAPYSAAADEAFVFGNTVATSGMQPNKKAQCDFLRWCVPYTYAVYTLRMNLVCHRGKCGGDFRCRGNQSGHSSVGSLGMRGQPCTPNV